MTTRRAGAAAVALLALVLIAACGQDQSAGDPPAPVTVTIGIKAGQADPAVHRVEVPIDAEVTVEATSDTAAEIHVHGYDEYIELEAPGTGSVTFTADQKGLFEIEAHGIDLLLAQLQVS